MIPEHRVHALDINLSIDEGMKMEKMSDSETDQTSTTYTTQNKIW